MKADQSKRNISNPSRKTAPEQPRKPAPGQPKKPLSAFSSLLLTLLFAVFSFWILAIKNASMLRWYDEMSLFESNWFYFRQFLFYPGGLLRYAGTYLTQLLYHPMLGTSILILLWLLLALLTRTLFKFRNALYPLVLLLPLTLLISVVQLDEAWLSIKSTGYVFFPTLGFLFTLAGYWLYRSLTSYPIAAAVAALILPLLYPVAGFFALLAGALCVIDIAIKIIRREHLQRNIATASILLIFIIVGPRLYYIYLQGNTVDDDFLHLKGLPELLMEEYDIYLWRPFIVAIALTLLYTIASGFRLERLSGNVTVRWVGIALIVAGGIWCVGAERKSEQLRATILMLNRLERNDWRGILHILSLTREEPNFSMLVLANLAKVNLGGESEDLSGYKPFNLDQRHAESFTMTAFVQVPVNYYIGRFNQSYRWAMEHTVQYGKRVYFLKYMVKDALVRGEIKLAKKYNDILLSTMFHRRWAQEINRYIENPELIKENPEFQDVLIMSEQEKLRGE